MELPYLAKALVFPNENWERTNTVQCLPRGE
jgi:hypothetical protein